MKKIIQGLLYLIIPIMIIFAVLGAIRANNYIEISKLELKLKEKKKELFELEKELEKRELKYEKMIDYEELREKMKKKDMVVASEIKYFQIEE